jgi:hypothetical protein
LPLTTQQKLDAALDAKHKLVTGQLARVFMDQNGERVEYTATNLDNLNRYIAELQSLVAGVSQARKPIGFIF